MSAPVFASGAFDNLRSRYVRFLDEASRLGSLTVLLWSDDLVRRITGKDPKFPLIERAYLLRALRYVKRVVTLDEDLTSEVSAPPIAIAGGVWTVLNDEQVPKGTAFCQRHHLEYRVFQDHELTGYPERTSGTGGDRTGRKKVIVTGCYDWLHSGHVRFFEEVQGFGDLYVVLGHDANIRMLKGEGHPLFPQEERRYVVAGVRYVMQALIATGEGWLDADPQIRLLKPQIYAVNEDGDRGGKREYCAKMGIEYLVLKRIPATGLSARSSTKLRGF
jgi:cytidyltransferase-like protein